MGVFSIGKKIIGSIGKKPATLMYPVVPREWEERTRGAVGIDVDGCVLCGMCQRVCPTNAIEVDRKASTWAIERMACVQCRGCVDACPPNCLIMEQKYTEPGEKKIDKFDVPPRKKAAKKDDAKAGGADTKAAAGASIGDGPLTCDEEACVYCGLCAKACPVDALEVSRKPEKVWKVDEEECIQCGACLEKCPKDCLSFGGKADGEAKAEEAKADEAAGAAAATGAAEAAKAEEAPAETAADKAEAADAPAEAAGGEAGLSCDEDSCVYCSACADACPVDAITVEDDSWAVDKDTCIECGACVDQCPADCLTLSSGDAPAEAEEAAEEKSAKEEAKEAVKAAVHEVDEEVKAKIDGYIGKVKESLEKDFGFSADDAKKKIEDGLLADQLKRFPFMMNREAKTTAERIKS